MITPNLLPRWNRASDARNERTGRQGPAAPIATATGTTAAAGIALSVLALAAHGQTFDEDFVNTTLRDAGQTTADWGVTVPSQLTLPSSNSLTGTFSVATASQNVPAVGVNTSRTLALGDLDGDGDLDLVEGTPNSQEAGVFLNAGGGFGARANLTGDRDNTRSIAIGDIDLDGDLDVVTGNTNTGPARLYLNAGDGITFTGMNVGRDTDDDVNRTEGVALADLNGDGFPDVAIANNNSQRNRLHFNTGDPLLPFGAEGVPGQDLGNRTESTHEVLAGDVDRDGDTDLVVVNQLRPNRLHLNNNGTFGSGSAIGAEQDDSRGGALGDVNGDGHLDLVVANYGAGSKVYLNTTIPLTPFGDSTTPVVPIEFAAAGNPDLARHVALGDADNDGDLDIFLSVRGTVVPNQLYLNDGTGMVWTAGAIGSDLDETNAGVVGDIDGDGALDFVAASEGVAVPNRLYLNPGAAAGAAAAQLQALAASLDVGGGGITSVKLSTTPAGLGFHNEVDFWASNDGGSNWRYATPDRPVALSDPTGVDVRWRAVLRSLSPLSAGTLAVDVLSVAVNTTGPLATTPIGPQTANEGVMFTLDLTQAFTADADGDPVFYSVSGLPVSTEISPGVRSPGTGLTLDPVTGMLSGIPTQDDVDASAASGNGITVTYTATDGAIATPDRIFQLTVTDINLAPSFTSMPVTAATRGVGYTYNVTTDDPDAGDVLTLTATIPPSAAGWLSLVDNGDGTGLLTGTPAAIADEGDHVIQLQVTDAAMAMATQDFTITVAANPSAPVVTLNGAPTVMLQAGDTYTEEGATATDLEDGPLAVTIGGDVVDTATAGTYIVTYTAQDSDGNLAQAQRTVTVTPTNTPPVITLNGAATVTLQQGDTYTEEGATANDMEDGDLTSQIQMTVDPIPVDVNAPGTYTITYSVEDSDGNMAQVQRTVEVQAAPTPTPNPNPSPAPTGGGGSGGSFGMAELLGLALLAVAGGARRRRRLGEICE